MSSAEQSSEPLRDFGSPATWGDVEQVRLSLGAQIDTQMADIRTQMAEMRTQIAEIPTQMAQLETRLENRMAEMPTQMAQLETRLENRMARLETRLIRWFAGFATATGVAAIGFLVGILQTVD